jgi:hypothetical protein
VGPARSHQPPAGLARAPDGPRSDAFYGYVRHQDGHEHYPKEGPNRGPKQGWDGRAEVSAGLDKCYTTDLFTARAKDWIAERHVARSDQPFFLYLAYDTPRAVCELPTQAYREGGGRAGSNGSGRLGG